jgi:phosphate-selective porin OprO/OprP
MASKNRFRLTRRAFLGWLLVLGLACSGAAQPALAQTTPYPMPQFTVLDNPPTPAAVVPGSPVVTPARSPQLLDVRSAEAELLPPPANTASPPLPPSNHLLVSQPPQPAQAAPVQPPQRPQPAPPVPPLPMPQPPQLFPQAQPLPPLPTGPVGKETEAAVGSDLSLKASWKYGLSLETPNKDFVIRFGGMVHYDLAFYTAGDQVQFGPGGVGALQDGTALRRGRLRGEGTMWEVLDFKLEFEFGNDARADNQVFGAPFPTDVYLTFTHLPVLGNVRIGNQKEVLSLEHLTPDRFLEFLERSQVFDAFIPSTFIPGITAFDSVLEDRATWAAGIYKNTRNPYGFGVGDGQYSATGRLTGLPLYCADGAGLWHVGVAASHRDLADGSARFRVRDSVRGAPAPLLNTLADTGTFPGGSQDLVILESALVLGPLSIQAEYAASMVNNASVGGGAVADVFFQGCYVEALYFLTGEHRNYNRKRGAFDRVIPHENFFLVRGEEGHPFGSGAWEVGVRFSSTDLTNQGIQGGVLQDLTLGLNWYLNPNAKIQWNYDVARRSATGTNSDGTIQGFGVRMAFDF